VPELNANGEDVEVGGVVLRTPGLAGWVGTAARGPAGRRGAAQATPRADAALDAALRATGVVVREELVLDRLTPAPRPGRQDAARRGRRTHALEVEVRTTGNDWVQVVLQTDAEGVATWHFAQPGPHVDGSYTGRSSRRFQLRTPPVAARADPATRGVAGTLARTVVRVLAFSVVDNLLGRIGDLFAGRWEQRHRPYRMRPFNSAHGVPADYASAGAREIGTDEWSRLSAERGRALLFLHGSFSRAHNGFGRLPRAVMKKLDRHYGGRVIAFDHHTLSEDPEQNVERFVERLPHDARLSLDVVCHSRGGLVARALEREQSAISNGTRQITVERIVFAGVPNAGTALADFDRVGDLVNTYTTLLGIAPDNGVVEVLESIVTVVKTIAVGALKGLDGLTAMRPDSPFLRALNNPGAAGSASYHALASDYEPATRASRDWLQDRAAGHLFGEASNDLVVPTAGVYDDNGSPCFPIHDRHVFRPTDRVAHNGYFTERAGTDKLLGWLRVP
jgi:hypothetical protein